MPVNPQALRVVHYPDPVLRRRAASVEEITDEVRAVAVRMIQLMHEHRGVGLAAPQVGLEWRLFVANPGGEDDRDMVFVNPVLLDLSEETESHQEGCLSIPHVTAEVRRPRQATIEATDLEGRRFVLSSDELAARIWQHEVDHLDGVLILDRMSPMDKIATRRAVKDLEREYEETR